MNNKMILKQIKKVEDCESRSQWKFSPEIFNWAPSDLKPLKVPLQGTVSELWTPVELVEFAKSIQ